MNKTFHRSNANDGNGLAVGAGVGLALGMLLDQLALGLALGTALGVLVDCGLQRMQQPPSETPKQ